MRHGGFANWINRPLAVITGIAAAVALSAGCGTRAGAAGQAGAGGGATVAQVIGRIESAARYRQSDWGYEVQDQASGQVLAAQNSQKMFDPGSTMKLYAVSAALRRYGPDYRFRTPVYREGPVAGGTLSGNLVLVASGDMSLGLREQRNGTLFYESLPEAD